MMGWLPENVSSYGARVDEVIRIIYYIVGAWFVLVEGLFVFFIVKFRRRPGVSASHLPGNTFKALAWILVPATAVLGFDIAIDLVQQPVWDEIKISVPATDQTVRITGRQFVWEFTHPGRDGRLGTADDIQTLNQLSVPVGKKIRFELEAGDVIHSLWIPNLRLKQDAVPGRRIPGWFAATREGHFPIACAELCGSGHGMMKGELHVLGPEAYERWLKENEPQPTEVSNLEIR